jgi:hypothetical protein
MKTREISRIRSSIVPVDSAHADLFADELPATPITLPHQCNEERAEDEELLSYLSPAPLVLPQAKAKFSTRKIIRTDST